MFPVELAKLRRCAIHPGVDGAYRICALCLRREEKGKSDAPIEFAADLPRPRSRYGGACMWLGAVCRPARQDRGTDDADRRDHAGRRSKGHRAGSLGHGAGGRARAGGAGSKARSRSSTLHPRPNRHLRLQRPRPRRQPPASAPRRWPVFAESSELRAAMTTMMMTTERGGPAPSFASCATAWRARRRTERALRLHPPVRPGAAATPAASSRER